MERSVQGGNFEHAKTCKYLREYSYEKAMLFMHVCVNDQTDSVVFHCSQMIFLCIQRLSKSSVQSLDSRSAQNTLKPKNMIVIYSSSFILPQVQITHSECVICTNQTWRSALCVMSRAAWMEVCTLWQAAENSFPNHRNKTLFCRSNGNAFRFCGSFEM